MEPCLAAATELFREVFEGRAPGSRGTWVIEGGESILESIRSVDCSRASKRVPGQRATIGAHVVHLTYYLSLFNAHCRGEERRPDWESSWLRQEFDLKQWREVVADAEREYAEAISCYRTGRVLTVEEGAAYALANLAHAEFHLGAIRALIPIVAS